MSDKLDTQKIKSEVNELNNDFIKWQMKREYKEFNKESFFELMKQKYSYLSTNSITLFERCIQGDLNLQHLNFILNKIDKVNSGADYQKTSTEVGQRLVDVYVKPLIENK